jgi:hypothetical protein
MIWKCNQYQLVVFSQSQFSWLATLFFILLALGLPLTALQAEQITPLYVGEKIEGEVAIYNTIKIPVENLDEWVNDPRNDASKFVLKIEGISFPSLTPTLIKDNTYLQFDLKRTLESKTAWKDLLSKKPIQAEKEVAVTVSQRNVIVRREAVATLRIFDLFWLKVFITISLVAVLLFWVLAYKSDVLRISGKQPTRNRRKAYSLARTQMAFWFFTIIISYMFIWMVTRDLSILTTSVLGLMGISAATGLGSAIIDANKQQEKENKYNDAVDQLKTTEVEMTQLDKEVKQMYASRVGLPDIVFKSRTDSDPLTEREARLAAKKQEVENEEQIITKFHSATATRASISFFRDILSDNNGYSFHRVQMFTWTVVLIIIFITSVLSLLTMPEFDTTLLGLVGISGATYLGFKFPNQQG